MVCVDVSGGEIMVVDVGWGIRFRNEYFGNVGKCFYKAFDGFVFSKLLLRVLQQRTNP